MSEWMMKVLLENIKSFLQPEAWYSDRDLVWCVIDGPVFPGEGARADALQLLDEALTTSGWGYDRKLKKWVKLTA